jgi:hypothetical protein
LSAFDATVRVASVFFQPIENEDGDIYDAHMILGVATLLPVGPDQVVPLPFGTLRVPLNHEALSDIEKQIAEVKELLKRRPQVETASSVAEAERLAEFQNSLK